MVHKVSVIPGDGVGPEVVEQACLVVESARHLLKEPLEFKYFELGGERFLRDGVILPEDALTDLSGSDAILLGAIGSPGVKPGIIERGLLLRLRFALGLRINLRPVRLIGGVESPVSGMTPSRCNFEIVRENVEGAYAGSGGSLYSGSVHEVATQDSVNTYSGVAAVVKYAFERALTRSGRVTLCHKTNVLEWAGGLWDRVVAETSTRYPSVTVDYVNVDAACAQVITRPERFDVIVTDNLFGDILADVAAVVQGGLGFAASANVSGDRPSQVPGLFEPVHGSAPDIAGQGKAVPIAAILSAALMLEDLGEAEAADAIRDAVDVTMRVPEAYRRTQDGATAWVGAEVAAAVG